MCHSIHVKVNEYNSVDLGLWIYGFNNGKTSWKNRLKILFNGRIDADLVVLNKEELEKFIRVLQECSAKLK
jgi:hypothetical protein